VNRFLLKLFDLGEVGIGLDKRRMMVASASETVSIAASRTFPILTTQTRFMEMKNIVALFLALSVMISQLCCQKAAINDGAKGMQSDIALDKSNLAERVRNEYMHAWAGYKKYAWGSDDLRPLSKTSHNWYRETLLMSAVDALDGLILLGFDEEAEQTKEFIVNNLSFDKDIFVKNFEVNIRLLGGLLSCHQLTNDTRLLDLAEDLGARLLPAFNSPTGMPYTYVNLKTGEVRDPNTNPAEIGTLILEFGMLSKLTNNPIFYNKAKTALVEVFNLRSDIDLVGRVINVDTGAWTDAISHIGGGIDSYYEYLLKGWLLFDDVDLKQMWDTHIAAIDRHLAMQTETGFWYGWVNMHTGDFVASNFGGLDAFFPAVLALSGDLERAEKLQASCYKMWNLHGLEPELLDFSSMEVVERKGAYHLNPEIIESAYYLYYYTKDPKYLEMGRTILNDLIKYCKTEAGYAAIKDVRTKEKMDIMESFLFSETLKYLYLLFAEEETIKLDEVVLTTEAHPLRKI